jgi:hypothetical protein
MRSIGLDVGRHVAEVAIVEPGRRTRSGGRIGASPESLEAFAATLGPDDQVVLERRPTPGPSSISRSTPPRWPNSWRPTTCGRSGSPIRPPASCAGGSPPGSPWSPSEHACATGSRTS